MKILLVLSLAVAAALAVPTEEITPNIVGGINALPGEFPYIVSIQWVTTLLGISTHVCGGAIISPVWVLSVSLKIYEIKL
jgi:secreted trypsin-like serine protease